MIVVVGATGNVGRHVTAQLAAAGVPTRATSRDPDTARDMLPDGVEIVAVEIADSNSLDRALAGADRAFLVTGGTATRLEHNVLAAARRAGVRHVVRLSGSFLVGPDATVAFDQWHHQAEQDLEKSGLAFTHLRPSYFMQNVLVQGASGTLALPFADQAVNLVDTRDIAAVAAAALIGDGHEGRTYPITGPEALTFSQVAEKLTATTGRSFTYQPVTRQHFEKTLLSWRLPAPIAAALALEYDIIGRGHQAFATVSDTGPRVTGRPATTFDQFARDHAEALRAAGGHGSAARRLVNGRQL
jgi:uncharacterized protein YbjT (DUF2867 family)